MTVWQGIRRNLPPNAIGYVWLTLLLIAGVTLVNHLSIDRDHAQQEMIARNEANIRRQQRAFCAEYHTLRRQVRIRAIIQKRALGQIGAALLTLRGTPALFKLGRTLKREVAAIRILPIGPCPLSANGDR